MADMDQGALGTRTSGHEGGRWADKHLEALAAGHEGPTALRLLIITILYFHHLHNDQSPPPAGII